MLNLEKYVVTFDCGTRITVDAISMNSAIQMAEERCPSTPIKVKCGKNEVSL